MKLVSYLNFNGQCAEAFRFYERVLGGKIVGIMTHGETPIGDSVAPEWRDRVMHAHLEIGDQVLFGSDSPPEYFQKPQGMYVSIHVDDANEAERIFYALAENGSVEMPIQQTFWASRFGMLTDQFGIPWMINCAPGA